MPSKEADDRGHSFLAVTPLTASGSRTPSLNHGTFILPLAGWPHKQPTSAWCLDGLDVERTPSRCRPRSGEANSKASPPSPPDLTRPIYSPPERCCGLRAGFPARWAGRATRGRPFRADALRSASPALACSFLLPIAINPCGESSAGFGMQDRGGGDLNVAERAASSVLRRPTRYRSGRLHSISGACARYCRVLPRPR